MSFSAAHPEGVGSESHGGAGSDSRARPTHTSRPPTSPTPPAPPPPARVRVILVGRTGQDAALRHDPDVELVRTHHALGAIGELASPMDADSPSATTVLVGPGVVEDDRARSFVAALRRVDEDVRVLVVSDRYQPVYDGSVPSDVTPEALRRLVHGPERIETLDEDATDVEGSASRDESGDASSAGSERSGDIGLDESSDEEAVVSALLPSRDDAAQHETPSALNGRHTHEAHAQENLRPESDDAESFDHASRHETESIGGDEARHANAAASQRWSPEALSPPPLPSQSSSLTHSVERPERTGTQVSPPVRPFDPPVTPAVPTLPTMQAATTHTPTHAATAGHGEPVASVLDAGPARAMLNGRSALLEALRTVRTLTGLSTLQVVPAGEAAQDALRGGQQGGQAGSIAPTASRVAPGADTPHIKLIHHGVLLGYLVVEAPATASEVKRLTPEQVEYLALWAALDRHEAQLREYAFTDELTGAYNRRFFNRFMETSLEQAKRTRQFLTLLYFDIDDFKLYNDRFGHAAGDEILVSVVALLKSVIRPGDKVCRLGGDEFGVIFFDPAPSLTGGGASGEAESLADTAGREARVGGVPQSISQIARRFQKQICSHRFPKLGEKAPGTLTVSGGMATFPWDGRDAEELLSRADELLLQSKAQGKNLITLGPGAEQVCRTDHETE